MKHQDESGNLHTIIQASMFNQGYPEEIIKNRTSAVHWLATNAGGQWPLYVEREVLGRDLFQGWHFIYDALLGEHLLAHCGYDGFIPSISQVEFDDYVQRTKGKQP